MARILFLVLSVLCQSLFAQTITDWEIAYNQRIDKAVSLKDSTATLDSLFEIALDFPPVVGCGNIDEETLLAQARIVERISDELKRRPETIPYLEAQFMKALDACQNAKGSAEKIEADKGFISTSDRIRCVFLRLPVPAMVSSLKRILEEHDRAVAGPYFTPVPSDHLERTVMMTLLISISPEPGDPRDRWASLDYWRSWFKEAEQKGRTYRFEFDPNEYDLTGPVRAAKNPDLPRATKRPGIQEDTSLQKDEPGLTSIPWIASIVAALLALGGWLFIRKQSAR